MGTSEVISWLLPTTYGTLLLRDIALRGIDPNWALVGGLIAIGLVLMLISWQAYAPSDCVTAIKRFSIKLGFYPIESRTPMTKYPTEF